MESSWKLEVPPKVRVFWWRVLHEFLPARHILWKRHIEPVANCEVCGVPEESIRHVLLDCTVAKEFWIQARIAIGMKLPNLKTATWAHDLLSDICPKRDQAFILCGMWALWMIRNKRRHGEQSMTLQQAVLWARDTAFDLWQLMHEPKHRDRVIPVQRWKPPDSGCMKINTDAAFNVDSRSGATACIIRYYQGVFQAAKALWYETGYDVCFLVAMACRDAWYESGCGVGTTTGSSGNGQLGARQSMAEEGNTEVYL